MTKKKVKRSKKQDDRILFAFLATFLSIIGFIIALIAKREDRYVMFYAKQSLIVFIVAAVAGVINGIFMFLPFIGPIINAALGILVFILWLLSWIYALSGEMKEIPVIGYWGNRFEL